MVSCDKRSMESPLFVEFPVIEYLRPCHILILLLVNHSQLPFNWYDVGSLRFRMVAAHIFLEPPCRQSSEVKMRLPNSKGMMEHP